MTADDAQREEGGDVAHEFTVSNEFTTVVVRKVKTRNGERLEISSRRVPHSIRLDALAAESLTWQTALEVGRGLETPFGPDPETDLDTDVQPPT